jgi:hypothetical protein
MNDFFGVDPWPMLSAAGSYFSVAVIPDCFQ